MKIFVSIILCLLIVLTFTNKGFCQADLLNKITVLQSTRSDVLKLLKQKDDGKSLQIFQVKDGSFDVSYSYGTCGSEFNSGWNVSENTVIAATFTFFDDVEFFSLKIDIKKLEKIRESPDVPDIITYVDRNKGIKYVVQPNGILDSMEYFPARKYETLLCPGDSIRP